MNDNRESRNLANDVRFTIDKKINFGKNRNEIDFYNFGVEITKSLEPTLYDSISCASSRLFIKKMISKHLFIPTIQFKLLVLILKIHVLLGYHLQPSIN